MKYLVVTLLTLACSLPACFAQEGKVDQLEQQNWSQAVNEVANSVVQIQTVGGLNRIGRTLLSQGPTTGLVITEDGYIVSSAFNFVGQPNSILVRLASGKQLPAEIVARDKNRLLVLLKVESADPLPVAEIAAFDGFKVGQWSIALGRTFQSNEVNVSVGIISGLNRRYGRVIQTDASISVANYGGPLIDVYGRVMGVLVPMAPAGAGGENEELAGSDFYDSGIGFAVPMPHVLAVLDRWKLGEDLLPGKLGVGLIAGPAAITLPKVSTVWPGSPAAVAGWKADDLIVKVNGQPVSTQSQLRFQVVPRYAGDTLNITIQRGEEEISSEITLAGELQPYRHAFLGVLPSQSDDSEDEIGIEIRSIWPLSPAAEVGLKVGDVVLAINDTKLESQEKAYEIMDSLQPEEAAKLLVMRAEQELTLSVDLSELPDQILSAEQLLMNGSEILSSPEEAKLESLKFVALQLGARFYDPDPSNESSKGMLLWLGDDDEVSDQQIFDEWQVHCRQNQMVLMIAHPSNDSGWTAEDLPHLNKLAGAARRRWKLDLHRTVIGGVEKAGQLAFALAFAQRKDFGGVVGIDAPLPRSLKIPANRPGVRLAILAVQSENSTFAPLIRRDLQRLDESGYPVSWLESPARSDDLSPLDSGIVDSLSNWIEGLNRF